MEQLFEHHLAAVESAGIAKTLQDSAKMQGNTSLLLGTSSLALARAFPRPETTDHASDHIAALNR
jgi:hypothetical protein